MAEIKFCDENTKKAYLELDNKTFQEKRLKDWLNRAFSDIEKDPACGIHIQKNLIPKEYIKEFGIDNLRKYDLPNGWRLIYTIKRDSVVIIAIILEWMSHKNCERRFGY